MKTGQVILSMLFLLALNCCINLDGDNTNQSSVRNNELSSQDSLKSHSISENINPKETTIQWFGIENSFYQNVLNPVTFSSSTYVYSKPDTTSEILQVLPFNTHLKLVKEGEIVKEIITTLFNKDGTKYTNDSLSLFKWYEINIDNKEGYVKATDIVRHSLTDLNNNTFFVKSDNLSGCTILKYSSTLKQFIDTLYINTGVDVVKPININEWKNVNILFRVSSVQEYCGGGKYDDFVIDSNDSLYVLTTSGYDNIEDITQLDDYECKVYFPLRDSIGEIQFVEEGDLEFNFDTIKFNSILFNTTIPKQEMIVRIETTEQAILNSKKEPVLDNAGNVKTKKISETECYQWNGNKLILINKEIKTISSIRL